MNIIHDNIDCIKPFIRLSIETCKLHPYFLTTKYLYNYIKAFKLKEYYETLPQYPHGDFVEGTMIIFANRSYCTTKLIDKSAKDTMITDARKYYLWFAVYHKSEIPLHTFKVILDILDVNLDNNPKLLYMLLLTSATRDDPDYLEFLVAKGGDTSIVKSCNNRLLYIASKYNKTVIVKHLIDKYLNQDDIKSNHNVLLRMAVCNNNVNLVDLVLSHNITYNDIVDTGPYRYEYSERIYNEYMIHSFHHVVLNCNITIAKKLLAVAPLTIDDMLYDGSLLNLRNGLCGFHTPLITPESIEFTQFMVATQPGLTISHIEQYLGKLLRWAIERSNWDIVTYILTLRLGGSGISTNYILQDKEELFAKCIVDEKLWPIGDLAGAIDERMSTIWKEYKYYADLRKSGKLRSKTDIYSVTPYEELYMTDY